MATVYYVSPYRIIVPLNATESIVYSTLTTSLIVLENDILQKVFNDHDYCDEDLCSELCEMGFLTVEKHEQLGLLREARNEVLNADTGITGVTIAPTMACNARCYYCFEKGARWGTMSGQTADAVADFLVKGCKQKKLYIAWFGGEPLLAPSIIDRITMRLQAAGIAVESTITTNGILLDAQMRSRLERWGTYRVQITLDGIGSRYNRIKSYVGIKGNPFDIIMENIQGLFDLGGVSVHIRLNYESTNRCQIEETFKYIKTRFGENENLYLYGAPLDMPSIKGYSEFDEDEGKLFLDVLHLSLDNGYRNDELDFRQGPNSSVEYNAALGALMLAPFPAPCLMTNRWRYVIDDRGLLYKCQKHLGKASFSCGDVFSGVQKNEVYSRYTTDQLHDKACEDCFMLPICQGGCNANRLLYGSKFACPPSKTIAKDLVKAYYDYLVGESEILDVYGPQEKGTSNEGNLQSHSEEGTQRT